MGINLRAEECAQSEFMWFARRASEISRGTKVVAANAAEDAFDTDIPAARDDLSRRRQPCLPLITEAGALARLDSRGVRFEDTDLHEGIRA